MEAQFKNPSNWMKTLRLNDKSLQGLLNLVDKNFKANNPDWPTSTRLQAVLKYLATGQGYDPRFEVTYDCIYEAIQHYFVFPTTQVGWKTLARDFQDKWNAPKTLGAVVETRVLVDCRPEHEFLFLDQQTKELGFIMTSAVDAKYRFFFSGRGLFGVTRSGDELIGFFAKRLLNSPFPDGDFSYTLVASKGFRERPFLRVHSRLLSDDRNSQITRALRPAEIAIEILFARFGVLKTKFKVEGDVYTARFLRTIKAIHNYFLAENPAYAVEYMDTSKLMDGTNAKKIVVQLERRLPSTDDEWMRPIKLDEQTFALLLNRVFEESPHNVGHKDRLRMILRFIVTGNDLGAEKRGTIESSFSAIRSSLTGSNGLLPFQKKKWLKIARGFEEKFLLSNCAGIITTKRVSVAAPAGSKGDQLAIFVLGIDAQGHILFFHMVTTFAQESGSMESQAVDYVLRNSKFGLPAARASLKFTTPAPFVFVGNDKLKAHQLLATSKNPGGIASETQIDAAVTFGQRVLKKICSRFGVIKFGREQTSSHHDMGTNIVFAVMHNFFLDHNPCYAVDFQE